MKKYNYSDIKNQFRFLLEAINEGQQSMEFDWYDCCDALSQVANARLNIEDFLDFQNMMKDVAIRPEIINEAVYRATNNDTMKQIKLDVWIAAYFLR